MDAIRTLQAHIEIRTDSGDDIPVVLATETPVDRGGFREIFDLSSPGNVILERNPLPVIESHDNKVNIGIVESLRVADRKLKGVLRMGSTVRAREILQDIKDRIIRSVSLGYRVHDFQEDGDTVRVTRFEPLEMSLVAVPADPNAQLYARNYTMAEDTDTHAGNPDLTIVQNERAWQKREHKRRQEIRRIFQPHLTRGDDYQTLLDACLDDPAVTVDQSRDSLLRQLGSEHSPLAGDYHQTEFHGSMDQRSIAGVGMGRTNRIVGGYHRDYEDEFVAACEDVLLMRGGIKVKEPHPATRDVQRMRLTDMAEVIQRQMGVNTSGMSRDKLASTSLQRRGIIGHGTSDFPNLLQNVANKAIIAGFMEAPNTHRQWVRTGSLPDFKQGSRVALSEFSNVEIVYENGEYKYGTYGDYKQTLQLVTYGKLFNISRQAIINDDTASFTAVPMGMAMAAMRAEADAAYAVLTGNPTMPDGNALFDASNHSNYVGSGSGATPSVTTIEAARVAMGLQTGLADTAYLNIEPAFLIVPLELAGTGRILRAAEFDPAAATLNYPNSVRDTFKVVADPRLSADSTTQWYMAADPTRHETVEIAFLDGNETPYLETKDGWTVDGVEFKCRHDFCAVAVDYRGLYCNDGS